MIRRFGEPVRRDIRYRHRPGAYALLVRKAEVLLTFQARPKPELQLPGGGVDPGEQFAPALHREVLEETGWGMQISKKLGTFRRFTYMPDYDVWAEKICHIYLARPTLKIGPPLEPDHEAVWTPMHKAVLLLGNDGDRHFAKRFLTGF